MNPLNLSNNTFDTIIHHDPYHVRLESASSIVSSQVEGSLSLGKFSCIANCTIQKYFNLGSFSFLSRTLVGRYVSIGSRVSVGGLNHPVSWLSNNEFQYSDMTDCFGETYPPDMLTNYDQRFNTRVQIAHDVWIGDNAVILSGVVIPTGCVIGAGSVVTKSPPSPYTIICGNPARVLRPRFNSSLISRLLESEWWLKDLHQLPPNARFDDPAAMIKQLSSD